MCRSINSWKQDAMRRHFPRPRITIAQGRNLFVNAKQPWNSKPTQQIADSAAAKGC